MMGVRPKRICFKIKAGLTINDGSFQDHQVGHIEDAREGTLSNQKKGFNFLPIFYNFGFVYFNRI